MWLGKTVNSIKLKKNCNGKIRALCATIFFYYVNYIIDVKEDLGAEDGELALLGGAEQAVATQV